MNTDRQPKPTPTRDPACCGTCAAIVSALTPEQLVKAPGQGGDLLLTRGTIVEADWPTGNRSTVYVDEGGYQLVAGHVGKAKPLQWLDGRIVRVLTEDKPTQEPVLPRRIAPEDVRVGMVVERRKGEAAHRDRVHRIDGGLIDGSPGWPYLWVPEEEDGDWSLWLIEDAPAPEDPDAKAIEVMARVTHNQNCCKEWDDHGNGTREVWREGARDALDKLWDEGYRIEANTMSQDAPAPVDPDAADRQCAWADYRKDYGVGEPEMVAAHKAFVAGWKAAREGDQSGLLR